MGGVKRLALLVGINYVNMENELRGCVNDVLAMRDVLVKRFGFQPGDMEVMTDEPGSTGDIPTGANIKWAIEKMISKAKEGDVLYFHYSGHGTLVPSLDPSQPHRQDEAVVPCDFNLITDMDLREMVNKVPKKATLTILSDLCHSGGLIPHEKQQIGPSATVSTTNDNHCDRHCRPKMIPYEFILEKLKQLTRIDSSHLGEHMKERFKESASLSFIRNDGVLECQSQADAGILLSGCQSNETSADVNLQDGEEGGKAYGAFSYAIRRVLKENPGRISNREIVMKSRMVLQELGFKQHPCLYCNDDNADAPFLLHKN